MKRAKLRGWISLPVLLAVAMFSWVLLQQNTLINESSLWQVRLAENENEHFWQAVYKYLQSQPSATASLSDCDGFCDLAESDWSAASIAQQHVYIQRHRSVNYDVTRGCASRDKREIRCWWNKHGHISMVIIRRHGIKRK